MVLSSWQLSSSEDSAKRPLTFWAAGPPIGSYSVYIHHRYLITIQRKSWYSFYHPTVSMTFAIFHDFPGLENGLPKFPDFP